MVHDRPKVLIVLSSANRRGAEIQGSGLAAELASRGFPTEVVALRPADGAHGLAVEPIGDGSPRSFRTLRELRRRCRSHDIVIGYGSVTLPACAVATFGLRTRFVYRSIGDPRAWARGRFHRWRTSLLYRRTNHVVALFDGAAEAISSLYRVDRSSITVIPNARSADQFRPPSAEERSVARGALGLPDDAPVVAVVGSFGPEKRTHLAVETMDYLSTAHLVVAGDGPERDAVQVAAGRVGERVHLVGIVDDVKQVYWAADAMLSTSSTEGMPGVLIEAALCGVPAVATDVGGTRDVVGPGGVLVDPSAGTATVGAAVERVLAEHVEISRVALAHVGRFGWDVVAGSWETLMIRFLSPDGD